MSIRSLYYLFVSWHFVCALAFNVCSTVQGYRHLQAAVPGSGCIHHLQRVAQLLAEWPIARTFAHYAGTATGYGFFAPQVGSSFQLEVTALDAHGEAVASTIQPMLKQGHSLLRYHSLLNRMQYLISGHSASFRSADLRQRQARAIAHCLSQRIARQWWGEGCHAVRCRIYVYGRPGLQPAADAGVGHWTPIYQHKLRSQPLP